jgi:hypothetical protein
VFAQRQYARVANTAAAAMTSSSARRVAFTKPIVACRGGRALVTRSRSRGVRG